MLSLVLSEVLQHPDHWVTCPILRVSLIYRYSPWLLVTTVRTTQQGKPQGVPLTLCEPVAPHSRLLPITSIVSRALHATSKTGVHSQGIYMCHMSLKGCLSCVGESGEINLVFPVSPLLCLALLVGSTHGTSSAV